MKDDLVCQGDFGHKIWGAASMMMEVCIGMANLSLEK
jgi:hypothetical protein